MASTIKEVREWLSSLEQPEDSLIAIDNGGLTLVVYQEHAPYEERVQIDDRPYEAEDYFEIGGVNIDQDTSA